MAERWRDALEVLCLKQAAPCHAGSGRNQPVMIEGPTEEGSPIKAAQTFLYHMSAHALVDFPIVV